VCESVSSCARQRPACEGHVKGKRPAITSDSPRRCQRLCASGLFRPCARRRSCLGSVNCWRANGIEMRDHIGAREPDLLTLSGFSPTGTRGSARGTARSCVTSSPFDHSAGGVARKTPQRGAQTPFLPVTASASSITRFQRSVEYPNGGGPPQYRLGHPNTLLSLQTPRSLW